MPDSCNDNQRAAFLAPASRAYQFIKQIRKILTVNDILVKLGRACILVFASIAFTQTPASEQPRPDIYNIEYYQLPNGLRVLLKERHQAKSVSFRVVVNVGMADYPCGRKETPHFLEHLLFSGTSTRDETELNDLIEEHGGEWNAFTEEEKTVYKIEIASKNAAIGLEALHEILTDTRITQENVEKGRDVIHRESGGRPSVFNQWFNDLGLGVPGSEAAHMKLLEGTTYSCRDLETADDINRPDILEAIDRYYVANNITLIVVGDFDSADMKKGIELAFGNIRAREHNQRKVQIPKKNTEKLILTSTLTPLLDNQALVGVAYASGGKQAPDYYSRLFVEKLLSDRLYRILRVEEGLSYAPAVEVVSHSNTDVWFVYADTGLSRIDEAVDFIQQEIDQLVIRPISDELLSIIKSKLIMSIAQGFESNREIADHYAESLHEIQENGSLVWKENKINALTAADIQRAANQIFARTPPIVFQDKPTVTHTQLMVYVGLFILFLAYLTFRYISRRN